MNSIILSSVVLLALDAVFLRIISKHFHNQILKVQKEPMRVNILGAILCYILLIFAINFFVLNEKRSPLYAALLGFIIYGVYETTSYALLKNWSLYTVLMDSIWGGILFGLTTYIVYSSH
jgi:uncharacterized membrane protein